MRTSARLAKYFSREWTVRGMRRLAAAAPTVLIATTIDRCLSVQVVLKR